VRAGGLFEPLEPVAAGGGERSGRPAGGEEPERFVMQSVREQREGPEGPVVRPVHVLEDEDERTAVGELDQPLGEELEHPVPRPLAAVVRLAELFEQALFDADEVGERLPAQPRHESDQVLVACHGGVARGRSRRRLASALDRRAEQRERGRVIERWGPAAEHPDPGRSDLADELGDQRRLPDARLPDEERHLPGTRPKVLEPVAKRFDDLAPADERAAGSGFGRHSTRSARWNSPSM